MDTAALTFALTDIHGERELLEALLLRCEAYAAKAAVTNPLYVFLGDYIDRGPDSAGVIRVIRAMSEDHDVVALKGNHDDLMVETLLNSGNLNNWTNNGAFQTAQSYGFQAHTFDTYVGMSHDPKVVDDAHWLESLPTFYEDELRYFVHAGIHPDIALKDQYDEHRLWIRESFLSHQEPFEKFVVHGHTPTREPGLTFYRNRCNLDSGAVFGGQLTAGVFDPDVAEPITLLSVGRSDL